MAFGFMAFGFPRKPILVFEEIPVGGFAVVVFGKIRMWFITFF
jgi:hypothetical protein